MESYLRIVALSFGLALALGLTMIAFRSGGPRYQIVLIGDHRFVLELAETRELRARGLRGRQELPADGGMLVRLEQPEVLTYSTRRTPFAIDVLYIGSDAEVLRIDHLAANDDRLTASSSVEPVWGAVLLPGGVADRQRLHAGARLDLGRPPRRGGAGAE